MRMMTLVLCGTLAALPLTAQEKQPAPTRTKMRVTVNGEDMTPDSFMQRRVRLGISVGLGARETDSIGAFVQTVSPGGPAAKAGLRSGDIITKLDGKVLSDQAGMRVAEAESPPGVRLIELAAKLEPNDTIAVEFLRGSQRQTVKLITGDEPMSAMEPDANQFFFRMPSGEQREFRVPGMTFERSPGPEGGERIEIMRRPGEAMVFGSGMLGDLELAPLNPDLGAYFGATEGILVIHAPTNPSLGLKGGDVVLSVDGRKPSNPSSLIRILRSYDEGDSFKLEVLRQKKRETITAKLGARSNKDE